MSSQKVAYIQLNWFFHIMISEQSSCFEDLREFIGILENLIVSVRVFRTFVAA